MRHAWLLGLVGASGAAGCAPDSVKALQERDAGGVCGEPGELPRAPAVPGDGERYCGTVCIHVDADLLGARRDRCGGTMVLQVSGDELFGIAVCSYQGIEGELGFRELFSGPQDAALQGQREGVDWTGQVMVQTPLGPMDWDWQGDWAGPGTPIFGWLRGESLLELQASDVSVRATGMFQASASSCSTLALDDAPPPAAR